MARSLPPELLRAIFSAARPPRADAEDMGWGWSSRTVLSFEERARAELVCKHWRGALSEESGPFTSLSISPSWPGGGWSPLPAPKAAATAAINKAVARARALATRAPTVTHVHMQINYKLSPKLLPAYLEALNALLACPGEHSFCLTANTSAQADVEAALAAMAPHAACERLEMVWRSEGRPIDLMPTKRLASLPHVRRMVITLDQRSMARLSLPMPRLEELTLPETPEMFAPLVARAVALVPASSGAVPFPALRRLSVTAITLILAAPTVPALEHLAIKLYFPQADLRLQLPASGRLPSSLTSLDLDASTINTIAMMEEGGDYGEDRSVRTNELAPLLAAAAPTLRQLRLTLAEPPSASLSAALRAATGVSHLELRFTNREWAAQDSTRLDCRLLGSMAQLRQLRTDAGNRLDSPAALAVLPLADLTLDSPVALPAIAPHTPGFTRLELSGGSAEGLHSADAAVGQALGRLTALRCLALGGRGELSTRRSPEAAAKAQEMEERHTAAVAALHALLPAGCEVQAVAPSVRLWG